MTFYPTLHEAVEKEHVDDVIAHLNYGADVDAIDSFNENTPLHVAVFKHNEEIVDLLINSNANLNSKNTNENTPLHFAALNQNLEITKLLIDAGADVDCVNSTNSTPLHLAVEQNSVALIKFLITRRANVNVQNNAKKTPVWSACSYGNIIVAKILIDAGASLIPEDRRFNSVLHLAVVKNNVSLMEFLLSCDIDVDILNETLNQTALHCASNSNKGNSHFKLIQLLLKNGANVNLQDYFRKTPLHYVVKEADIKTVRLFLNYKADVSIKDNEGKIPLCQAVENDKNIDVVRFLVKQGSDVNYVNVGDKLTPLHYASSNYTLFDAPDPFFLNLKPKFSNESLVFLLKYNDVNAPHLVEKNLLNHAKPNRSAWKTILEHLAKLQALDFPVHPDFVTIIADYHEFNYYFNKCSKELLLAKNTKLQNSWVTYFNLIVDGKKKLKNYAGNKKLVKDFENSIDKKKFWVYGASMRKNMAKGILRRKLFDKSAVLLSSHLQFFSPSHLIIRDILDCINTKDLSKLCI